LKGKIAFIDVGLIFKVVIILLFYAHCGSKYKLVICSYK